VKWAGLHAVDIVSAYLCFLKPTKVVNSSQELKTGKYINEIGIRCLQKFEKSNYFTTMNANIHRAVPT
jgi:hypothetical protein